MDVWFASYFLVYKEGELASHGAHTKSLIERGLEGEENTGIFLLMKWITLKSFTLVKRFEHIVHDIGSELLTSLLIPSIYVSGVC